MTTNKFLTIATNGIKLLTTAISTYIDAATSGNKIIATGADGKLDTSFLPAGIGGSATITAIANEALTAGNFVNIYDNAGVRTCRKADASNGRAAHGFISSAVALSGSASIKLSGENTAVSGLSISTVYYLSATTAGSVTETAPTASNSIIQELGYATSTTSLVFEYDSPVTIL